MRKTAIHFDVKCRNYKEFKLFQLIKKVITYKKSHKNKIILTRF